MLNKIKVSQMVFATTILKNSDNYLENSDNYLEKQRQRLDKIEDRLHGQTKTQTALPAE